MSWVEGRWDGAVPGSTKQPWKKRQCSGDVRSSQLASATAGRRGEMAVGSSALSPVGCFRTCRWPAWYLCTASPFGKVVVGGVSFQKAEAPQPLLVWSISHSRMAPEVLGGCDQSGWEDCALGWMSWTEIGIHLCCSSLGRNAGQRWQLVTGCVVLWPGHCCVWCRSLETVLCPHSCASFSGTWQGCRCLSLEEEEEDPKGFCQLAGFKVSSKSICLQSSSHCS